MSAPDRLTCEEVFRRLEDFLDRELDEADLRLVREHLEACAGCSAEYEFERRLLAGLREKLRRIACPSDLLERIQRLLAQPES
jgi:anti-sigma factor (TIGR02949 family)